MNNVHTAPSASGTYTINVERSSKQAFVRFIETDANCRVIASTATAGMSGTVTITSISGGSYSANFDVTLDSGDHVSGSFRASNCPSLATFGMTQVQCT